MHAHLCVCVCVCVCYSCCCNYDNCCNHVFIFFIYHDPLDSTFCIALSGLTDSLLTCPVTEIIDISLPSLLAFGIHFKGCALDIENIRECCKAQWVSVDQRTELQKKSYLFVLLLCLFGDTCTACCHTALLLAVMMKGGLFCCLFVFCLMI